MLNRIDVGGNPVNAIDSNGLKCEDCVTPFLQCKALAEKQHDYMIENIDKQIRYLHEKREFATKWYLKKCNKIKNPIKRMTCRVAAQAEDYAAWALIEEHEFNMKAIAKSYYFSFVAGCYLQYGQCKQRNQHDPCCDEGQIDDSFFW